MSSNKETQIDMITSNNQVIAENLSKINEKIAKIKSSLVDEEESEYENFYNRINFYFSNIVTELKLSFVEKAKEYQNREIEMKTRIGILEDKLRQVNLDKMHMVDEIKQEKKKNSALTEKLAKLEEEFKRKNDNYEKNIVILTRKNKSTESDVMQLLVDNMILKIELENSYSNADSKVDETQYVEIKDIPELVYNKESKERILRNTNTTNSKLSLLREVSPNPNLNSGLNPGLIRKSEKSRNIHINTTTSPMKDKFSITANTGNYFTNPNEDVVSHYKTQKSHIKIHDHQEEPKGTVINSNYTPSYTQNYNYNPNYTSNYVTTTTSGNSNVASSTTVNLHQKSQSMISNYRKNASSIKDLKGGENMNISRNNNNNNHTSNNRVNLSAHHKSFTNIPVMSSLKSNLPSNTGNTGSITITNSNPTKNLNLNLKNSSTPITKTNNYLTTQNNSNKPVNEKVKSIINMKESYKLDTKLDKNLINSSLEFEKYKSSLLEKLSIKRGVNIVNNTNSSGGITGISGISVTQSQNMHPTMINDRFHFKK